MKYNLIASGSKGNSLLIYSKDTVLLFDFGVSKKKVSDALACYNLSFDKIDAFFFTHLHHDHCLSIAKADSDLIYCGCKSINSINKSLEKSHQLESFKEVQIKNIKVTPLPLSHDCKESDTFGFVIDDGDEKLAYITDTGFIPEINFPYLDNLDYYIFESNFDPKMLYESNRPEYLINRIMSDKGHMSNNDSSYYLSTFLGNNTKEIVLAHLSEECNTKEIAKSSFETVSLSILGYIPDVKLKISSFYEMVTGGK